MSDGEKFEYVVKPVSKYEYHVYKFIEGNDIPEGYYKVTIYSKMKCDCPSGMYRGYCKHKEMVKAYRKKERAGASVESLMMFFRG